MMTIRLPGGGTISLDDGSSVEDAAKKISNSLAKKAFCGEVDGKLTDMDTVLTDGVSLRIITAADAEAVSVVRHTTSHIMAQAVKRLFPEALVAIGPSIENGFYYDFDLDHNFTEEDLSVIEKEMRKIVKENLPVTKKTISFSEALSHYEEAGEIYKADILRDMDGTGTVTIYTQGDFSDLCRGPHLRSTGKAGHFKLLSVAGAYWRGDEKNKMLQRIYGTAFLSEDELAAHLEAVEEAKRRDHRKLGKQMDLFSIHPEFGPGLPFWHPRGAFIRRKMEDYLFEELLENGYSVVNTPHIAKSDLWKTSGHWNFYRDNMFSPITIDEEEYLLKPMNCPFHVLIFDNEKRSYRELPFRLAELGTVYRYERSGVLHGLMRVRGFTQDDAHIFCTEKQLNDEIISLIGFTKRVLNTFGFEKFDVYLSTRPEKYVGDPDSWDIATDALKKALEQTGLPFEVDPGEGVFYGPKIDIKIRDSLNRSWQCTTIQVDFNLPERFDLKYTGEDGEDHRPIMIHRALMGSLERFFGILIEHYAGAFPAWLSPVQARILPISDKYADYAGAIRTALKKHGIRAEIDERNEKIGYKIRDVQTGERPPYMVIVGEKEAEAGTVSVRSLKEGELGSMTIESFSQRLVSEIAEKR